MLSVPIICAAVREREIYVRYLQKHLPTMQVCWDKKRSDILTYLDALAMAKNGAA